jgi:predicted transposase/invertase (TIGR01784 family)
MDFKKYEDAIFKNAMECFADTAAEFFHLDAAVMIPARTELQSIEINKVFIDYLFYTQEGSYLHFEFQTTHKKDDLARFMYYDALLYHKDRKPITTIVIYSADIEEVHSHLDIGAIQYNISPIYMTSYNGDAVLEDIKNKIENNKELTSQDIMKLTFSPIMGGVKHKAQRAIESIELVKTLKNEHVRLQSIAMLYAFIEKFGDETTKNKFKEVFAMTEIGRMLLEEGIEKGIEQGIEQGIEKGKMELLVTQLTSKFRHITEEDVKAIKNLPSHKLNIISVKIFDIASLEELRTYFD